MAQALAAPVMKHHWPMEWDEEAVAQLPDDGHRYEIYEGTLTVTPPANWEHQGIESDLAHLLRETAPSGWRILTDLGVDCGGYKLVPDIAAVRPMAVKNKALYGPVKYIALVVEVESRSTRMNDRNSKHVIYAEAGVPSYWRGEETKSGWVIVVYELAGDEYKQLHRLEPGQSASLTQPFPLELTNDL